MGTSMMIMNPLSLSLSLSFLLLLLLLNTCEIHSCIISGTDSGFCDFKYHTSYYSGSIQQLRENKMNNDFGTRVADVHLAEAHNYWGGERRNAESTCTTDHGLDEEALKADIRSPRQDREQAASDNFFLWDEAPLKSVLEPLNVLNASLGETGSRYYPNEKHKALGDHCMPFCGKFIFQEVRDEEFMFPGYVPCVPRDQSLPVDRNFPSGRFTSHTAKSKDAWVELAVTAWILRRNMAETDEMDLDEVVDEYGISDEYGGGTTALRFTKGRLNQDCIDAFTRYMCSINFPRCDENEESLRTCESTCMNLFYTCGFSTDLYRCGASEFFNGGLGAELPGAGGTPEVPNMPEWISAVWDKLGGSQVSKPSARYWRDYFPGQPFKPNEFLEGTEFQEPIAVCTPSIKGGARARWGGGVGTLTMLLGLLLCAFAALGTVIE